MKKVFVVIIAVFAVFLMFACSGESFSDINIVAENVENIPEGEYTLRYSIDDFEKFSKKYDLDIRVSAFDQDGKLTPVTNNRTISVKPDCTYTVTVLVSAKVDGEIEKVIKTFNVTAEKNPRSVKFYVGSSVYKDLKVDYGTSLSLDDFLPIPDMFTAEGTGITQTILSKKWTIETEDGIEELTEEHLKGITRDIIVRAQYDYDIKYRDITVSFDNGEGATETEAITQIAGTVIEKPVFPTRDGYIFDGWYYDESYERLFTWRAQATAYIVTDLILHAKWLKNDTAEFEEFFEYKMMTDVDGYYYYNVILNRDSDYPTEISVPVGHDNIPVKGFFSGQKNDFTRKTYGAFEATYVTEVTLPAEFRYMDMHDFADCADLSRVIFAGNKLTTFSVECFKNCTSLEEITIPEGVITTGAGVFSDCSALKTVILPSTLLTINDKAFLNCTALETIALPDGLDSIRLSFAGCTSLREVHIGERSRLTYISRGAFEGCTELKAIALPYSFSKQSSTKDIFEGLTVEITYHPQLEEKEEE